MKSNFARTSALLILLAATGNIFLTSCGGGGAAGGSSSAYTISGTVSGLVGSGLVLQNNGGDNLAVKANGTFKFKSRITSGASYNVTVLTQPGSPDQTCRVINSNGNATSDVTGIGVRCADQPDPGLYLFEEGQTSLLNLATIDPNTGALSSPILSNEVTSGSLPNIVVTPNQLYLYALFVNFGQIKGYVIQGPGLRLFPIEGSPFISPRSDSGGINSEVLHQSGKFLYMIEFPGKIEDYSLDAAGIPTSNSLVTEKNADFVTAAIDPAGKFLIVPGGYQGIFVYAINQSSGALSAVANSPFSIPGGAWSTKVVMEAGANYIYTPLAGGGIAAFALNNATGALTNISGSPFFTTTDFGCVAVDPVGGLIYTCNFDGSIDGFEIDESSGTLTELMGFPLVVPSPLTSVIVDPKGRFLYASSLLDTLIYGYGIDSRTGELSPLTGSPYASVANPTGLFAVDIQ